MNAICIDCSKVGPWSTPHGLRCHACYRMWARVKAGTHRYVVPPTGRCAICGGRGDLTWDHIKPVAKGGTSTRDNLRVLCRSCNSRKGKR